MHCKYRVVLSSLAAVFFSAAVSAQSTVPGVLTAPDEPSVWVNAMVDPSANVYDAVAQFEAYWKDRPVEKGHGCFNRRGGQRSRAFAPGGPCPSRLCDQRSAVR